MAIWDINEAQACFERIVDQACSDGPQTIQRGGADLAVVLSNETYRALLSNMKDRNDAPAVDSKSHSGASDYQLGDHEAHSNELERLLAGITDQNVHGEVDFGPSIGKEARL